MSNKRKFCFKKFIQMAFIFGLLKNDSEFDKLYHKFEDFLENFDNAQE